MIDWISTKTSLPPEEKMVLMFTEDDDGHAGGIVLGGMASTGEWVWFKGLEEVLLQDYKCTYWCLADNDPRVVSTVNWENRPPS